MGAGLKIDVEHSLLFALSIVFSVIQTISVHGFQIVSIASVVLFVLHVGSWPNTLSACSSTRVTRPVGWEQVWSTDVESFPLLMVTVVF